MGDQEIKHSPLQSPHPNITQTLLFPCLIPFKGDVGAQIPRCLIFLDVKVSDGGQERLLSGYIQRHGGTGGWARC